MNTFDVPLYIRGELIEQDWVEFGSRQVGCQFRAPAIHQYIERLPLANPRDMADLYAVPFEEILDVLEALGQALEFASNQHVQQAYEAGLLASNYPAEILKSSYIQLPSAFDRAAIKELAEQRIGIDYLEGWVNQSLEDGRDLRVRAFGARALHIPAGNGGLVSAVTIIRNVITRSDAIIKVPSNDPLTALAIVRTLRDIAPEHPITKHLCVGYWKGGDSQLEQQLYQPRNIEKIVAWGGFASVKHVTQYVQPGLELISLDPKRSATIIGEQAFASDASLQEVAARLACDIGVANQEACASARVVYVLSGTDADGIERINRLGELVYEKLMAMPDYITCKPKTFDRELAQYLDATRLDDTFYRIIGGEDLEGAVVVSQFDQAVDYSAMLSGRVANLVPIDHIDSATRAVNAYTQTVGIYPDLLKQELRDILPLYGAQRLTSLGYACSPSIAAPQDAIEPVRRMCKWIVEETCEPSKVLPLWELPAA